MSKKFPQYIQIAKEFSKLSKDPSTQVGAIILDFDNTTLSTGYNGMVAGSDEEKMWTPRSMKLLTVIHAEMNALLFCPKRNLQGCKVLITHGPCHNCLKHLLQAGVREFYYKDPSIIRDRGTDEEKEAICILIKGTGATVKNINGNCYVDEIYEKWVHF
jgi:deoxycytidylate deaminase